MTAKHSSLRKAAILISCLEPAAAERILEQMLPEQRQAVRDAQRTLGPVNVVERSKVLEEFFSIGPIAPPERSLGVELEGSLAERLELPPEPQLSDLQPVVPDMLPRVSAEGSPRRFDFLDSADVGHLTQRIANEHPQIIAVIVSHLRPEKAAEVLADLPATLQTDVAGRLVELEETDPEVLAEIEQGMQQWLVHTAGTRSKRTAGLQALEAILSHASHETRQRIVSSLSQHDRELAARLAPPKRSARPYLAAGQMEPRTALTFELLARLDDESLTTVLHASDTEVMLLALVGASDEFLERVLRQLPFEESRTLRYALDHVGPTRLSDVEEAQHRIALLAEELLEAGRLNPRVARTLSLAV
jgi:flagellar motor switch protein FliG